MSRYKPVVIYVVNVDWFLITHRLPLLYEALKRGYKVIVVTRDSGKLDEIRAIGVEVIPVNFDRSGKNPFKEISIYLFLKKLYKDIRPDIIHHVTFKPSVYGTIAAKSLNSDAKIINAVSGMGYSFTRNRKTVGKFIMLLLMKYAFKDKKNYFIFQNPDDKKYYEKLKFLTEYNNIIVKGAGVDEQYFKYESPTRNPKKVIVVLVARMLKDKGVFEFIRAAKYLKESMSDFCEFKLVGGIDLENPASISENELTSQMDGEYLIWRGHRDDIRDVYINADIVCLPSYREGLPKSLVEAMAVGRPIIATDSIGCRECVESGVNGYLVPIGDYLILANRIKYLVENVGLRIEMGKKSREIMLRDMTQTHVVNKIFELYES